MQHSVTPTSPEIHWRMVYKHTNKQTSNRTEFLLNMFAWQKEEKMSRYHNQGSPRIFSALSILLNLRCVQEEISRQRVGIGKVGKQLTLGNNRSRLALSLSALGNMQRRRPLSGEGNGWRYTRVLTCLCKDCLALARGHARFRKDGWMVVVVSQWDAWFWSGGAGTKGRQVCDKKKKQGTTNAMKEQSPKFPRILMFLLSKGGIPHHRFSPQHRATKTEMMTLFWRFCHGPAAIKKGPSTTTPKIWSTVP